ncbi:hypothetical protein BX666DRAFT_2092990, partial [Dichotomocladium elegans]
PNWTLFCCLFSIGVPAGLVAFPWIYKKNGKFKKLGKFCIKPRTNMIFTSFYTLVWASAGIAMSVFSNDPNNCAIFGDMEEAYGDEYLNAWPTQCNNAKVANGFSWTLCILWLMSLLCSLIILWKEKQIYQDNNKQYDQSRQNALQQKQQLDEEYARPLNYTPSPSPAPHTQPSPFDSPYDMHIQQQQQQQQQQQPYDPYPEQPFSAVHTSPFQDPHYAQYSPEPPHNPAYVAPSPPQGHPPGGYSPTPTPMPMPDPTLYHSSTPDPNARF